MSVTAPETEARAALKAVIDTEFATEGFTAANDRLHGSLGWKGTVIGLSPIQAAPQVQEQAVLRSRIMVQFYGKWDKKIDPTQSVDPVTIETYAERFRNAIRTGDPDSNSVWFFRLISIQYPPDPTGNITRFEATVEAVGNNSALYETSA
jgi:hypothetical protein